jgi:hypothetical protein
MVEMIVCENDQPDFLRFSPQFVNTLNDIGRAPTKAGVDERQALFDNEEHVSVADGYLVQVGHDFQYRHVNLISKLKNQISNDISLTCRIKHAKDRKRID